MKLKTLHFENRSFRQDRPSEISFEISGRTLCFSSKIDLFITIAPEAFLSNYLNIAPNCAQRGNILCNIMLKCFLPCERNFPPLEMDIVLTIAPKRPQARAARKCFEMSLNNHSFFV